MRRSLIVSLHDVSPHSWSACQEIVARLAALGIPRVSLLVIPDHHHRGHWLEDPEFVSWLRDLESSGHEAVLHGYYHLRPQQKADRGLARWITGTYTAGEGEFFDLNTATALDRCTRGRAEFLEAGLACQGFIAPAWLLGPEARQVLLDLQFRYTVHLADVTALHPVTIRYPVRTLCWSTRAWWRRECSLAWNAFLYSRTTTAETLRISIHPPDLQYLEIWTQIERLCAAATATRTAETYLSWIESR
jgi:predicted deacetylase